MDVDELLVTGQFIHWIYSSFYQLHYHHPFLNATEVETNGARTLNQLMVCSYGKEEDLYVKFRLKRCGIQHLKRKY